MLTFQKLIVKALIIGFFAGFLMCVMQIFLLNPIIFEAESYEVIDSHSHENEEESWAPSDGYERTYFTLMASVLVGVGFASVLLALISYFQLMKRSGQQITLFHGLLWGVGGYLALFLAPSIGLPPEIPGMERAPVEYRQLWWLFTAACVVIAGLVTAFSQNKYRFFAIFLIALPYLIGAPELSGLQSFHPDPGVAQAQASLQSQFILFSGLANLIFWLVIGVCAAKFLKKYSDLNTVNDVSV